MTTVRFQINRETILKDISTEEWEAMEMAQDGEVKIYRLRPVLARFVVDEATGKVMPQSLAMKKLGKIPFEEFMSDVFKAFFETLQNLAVPNTNGGSLNKPSEADGQTSESPIGSAP